MTRQKQNKVFCESEITKQNNTHKIGYSQMWCRVHGRTNTGALRTVARELQHVNVMFKEEFVNAFRLQKAMESHGPFDIVVCFGTWPNVLTDEICKRQPRGWEPHERRDGGERRGGGSGRCPCASRHIRSAGCVTRERGSTTRGMRIQRARGKHTTRLATYVRTGWRRVCGSFSGEGSNGDASS